VQCLANKGFTAFPYMATLALFRSTYLVNTKMLLPEKRAKIIAALKANSNARAVAQQVGGVSFSTVKTIAKQTGIDLTSGKEARRNALPRETRAKIIAALKANPNVRAVTQQVGSVSSTTVWNIAKQTGIKLRRS
jgi:hypothetical protein